MPAELVFVHGIGGHRDAAAECRRWTEALALGARKAGHSALAERLPEIPIRFAAYRDLYDDPGAQGDDLDLDPEAEAILVDLLAEVIDSHSPEDTDESTRWALDQAREQLDPSGQAQGTGSVVARAIDAATTLMGIAPLRRAGQWLSGRLMLADLAQVARYLAREPGSLDVRIRGRLLGELDTDTSVVVAHSLGTIVAFETLHEYAAELPLFVTLGSPIGMRTVVWPRLVPQPVRTPPGVRRWLNFWDRDDIIVARRHLDIEANALGVRPDSSRLDSDGVWRHTATKYLAQPGVAAPYAEALGGGR
jgi:hypothetical protein